MKNEKLILALRINCAAYLIDSIVPIDLANLYKIKRSLLRRCWADLYYLCYEIQKYKGWEPLNFPAYYILLAKNMARRQLAFESR